MRIKISDILDLFELVSSGSPFDSQGYICKTTGKTYFYTDFADFEEEEALPEDVYDEEKYLAIPHKNDLDLGRDLVFDFVEAYLPSEYENVRSMFQRKGAYARFKALLDNANQLEQWYQFEANRTEQALRAWCEAYDVEIID